MLDPIPSTSTPTKADTRLIRSQLDVLFPDTDGETMFSDRWKDDVADNPVAYPQIMQVLSTAIPDTASKFIPAVYKSV